MSLPRCEVSHHSEWTTFESLETVWHTNIINIRILDINLRQIAFYVVINLGDELTDNYQ